MKIVWILVMLLTMDVQDVIRNFLHCFRYTQLDCNNIRTYFWEMRTNEQYQLNVKKTLSCNSKTAKSKMETRFLLFSSAGLTIFLTKILVLVNLIHHCF